MIITLKTRKDMAITGWADIAVDLLFLLAERVVGVTTFVRLSAVCKSWYSVASATKCCNPVPWLMFGEKEGSELRDFYDHSTGELYQFSLRQAKGMKIVGSADHGWLITASGVEAGHFYLLNILNGARMTLPYTDKFPCAIFRDLLRCDCVRRNYFIVRAACSPIEPNGDYIVATNHMGYSCNNLVSYCRSTDKEWSDIDLRAAKNVGFVSDLLFVVTFSAEIYYINFSTPTPSLVKIVKIPLSAGDFGVQDECYMMECAGAILVVCKLYAFHNRTHPKTFEVFKLDVEGKKALKVKTIGDYVMFLGTGYSVCLPITSCMITCKRSCVYFVDDQLELTSNPDWSMDWRQGMNVFNLEDGSFSAHYTGRKLYTSPIMPTWVMVNDLQVVAG